jgi:hypothetical protein
VTDTGRQEVALAATVSERSAAIFLPRTTVATPLDLHLDAGAIDRSWSASDGHHANDAIGQTRHLAACIAEKVRMLRAVISILAANEFETPQMPEVFSGDETGADKIHQVTVQGGTIVGEVREPLDEISVG